MSGGDGDHFDLEVGDENVVGVVGVVTFTRGPRKRDEDLFVLELLFSGLLGGTLQSRGEAGWPEAVALWSGTNKNRDVSTGPLARPFARSLAPLTRGYFFCFFLFWTIVDGRKWFGGVL